MSDDRIELEVTPESAKLAAEGGAVARLGNAFADAISPFTNSLGAVGDLVTFYRQENAIRALVRAKELSTQSGIAIEPVQPKFLLKWIEEASLEEPNANGMDLTDLWAGLLVSASQASKPSYHYFRRILGEITHDHYLFLDLYLRPEDGAEFSLSSVRSNIRKLNNFVQNREKSWNENDLQRDKLIGILEKEVNGNAILFTKARVFKSSGVLPHKEEHCWSAERTDFSEFNAKHVPEMLERMGLIRRHELEFISKSKEFIADFEGEYRSNQCAFIAAEVYALTAMGADFLTACLGKGGTDE